MTSISSHASPTDRLRRRILVPCWIMRALAALWFLSGATHTFWNWSDRSKILGGYSRWLQIDLTQAPAFDYGLACTLLVLDHLVALGICVTIWQLTATCLQGNVFSLRASRGLQLVAKAALLSLSFDILVRHVLQLILTAHTATGAKIGALSLTSLDALHLLIICFVFTLSYMFVAAAEIAEEQAGFV